MNITDAYYVIKAYVVSDVPVFLWGHRGIGKSSLIKQIGEELNIPVIDLRLATQEVSDLIGIPSKEYETHCPSCKSENVTITKPNGDEWGKCNDCNYEGFLNKFIRKGKTKWLMPEWFPGTDQPEGILFLDEMNRAQRDVVQAAFQLVLDRRLHTHTLPPGWKIVAAGNYLTGYDVRELDEAMMSRFGHVEIEADHNATCNYGIENKWASRITNFLRSNPKFTIMTPEDAGGEYSSYSAQPDPRRWEMVDALITKGMSVFPQNERAEHLVRVMLTGLVGEAAARAFMSYSEKLPSFEDILKGVTDYDKMLKSIKENKLNAAIEKTCMEAIPTLKNRKFAKAEYERAITYFLAIERRDLIAGVLQQLVELRNANRLKDAKWTNTATADARLHKLFKDMLKYKGIDLKE